LQSLSVTNYPSSLSDIALLLGKFYFCISVPSR